MIVSSKRVILELIMWSMRKLVASSVEALV